MRLALPILAALAATLLAAMGWLTLTVLQPHAGGLPPLDARILGYTPEQALGYLGTLDGTGRSVYLLEMRLLDTLFPPVLAMVAGLAVLALTRGMNLWSRVVLLVPVAGYMVMDLCENALIGELLRAGVDGFDAATAQLASEFTVTKWVLLGISLAMLGILVIRALRRGRGA